MAGIDRVKYPSLPSNYVTIAELKERWLKEKERKEQEEKEKLESEEKEKYPVLRNHENRIVNGCAYSQGSVGKNLQKRENHSGKGWREVGLIAKEPKLKEVRMNGSVVEEGVDRARGKEKMGCFVKRGARVERDGSGDMAKVTMIDVEEEELMAVVSAGRGGKESSKGNCKWNSGNQEVEEVATVCMVEVVGESNVDREIAGGECRVGYRGKKNSWNAEQSGQIQNAGKEKVLVDVTEKVRVGGAFRAYGDKEVASVCAVEVVGENKVDREITGQNCGVGNRGKKNGGRKMGVKIGEVSDKADSVEQSGRKHNVWKEKVTVDVIERTNEKVRLSGAFHAYSDKEVASVCTVEVVGENKVDREVAGQNCGVGFRVNNNSWREVGNRVGEASNKADSVEQSGQKHNAGKEVVPVDVKERTHEKVRVRGAYRGKKNSSKQMVDRVGEVSDKADSVEKLGQECNAETEKVSVDLKERTNEKMTVSGAFRAYSAKEAEEVATVCTVKVVEENKVDREISGKKHRVGFKGKKPSWRKIGDRVGEVSDKANSVEQSGRECNAEKEKVSVDVKERTNEKVRVKGAFGDNKEVEEVATVCTVEEVEEIKVDGKTARKKRRVWYKGKKHSGRKMANRVGKVSDKADSAELSGQERNAEKEEISVDVKERANEKARVRGAFCANSDKSKDVLISEAGLNRTIEGDLGDLSLTNRRYGHGRSSVRVYGGKSYGSSRRYDVRKFLKQRDNSFAWIKKGESSNGNVAEIETQG
ncbi:uncharacterized protein LOC107007431 isoform X1 [Solanum pennellii]|uniref:Uncharacterized protein LOC107007431 isoform X1 n=1 Tax=Solanum pennellii TaxID=28526 RepID=A0ABM1FTL8_SOLPN|nr:uncharacterized protein LOC107007431 isoform X1 [Solanum pennellii]